MHRKANEKSQQSN